MKISDTLNPIDDYANQRNVIDEKMIDAAIPGAQTEFTPEEAEVVGAFIEDALNEIDVYESQIDSQELVPIDRGGAS